MTGKVTITVKEWFSSAHEDLMVAQVLHQLNPEKYLRTTTFHCQQAAEKSIKGYLSYKKIKFEKIHVISKLAILVLPHHPELENLLKEADDLTDYAVEFRYPESTKKNPPTLDDAKIALPLAKKVYETMVSLIPFESQWKV